MAYIRVLSALSALALTTTACSNGDGLQDINSSTAQDANSALDAALILRFRGERGEDGTDPARLAAQAATASHTARIHVARDDFSGLLVFKTMDDFAEWRSDAMDTFFSAFGNDASLTSVRVLRPKQLPAAQADALARLAGDVSITYQNADNSSEGDADIDAVTVICGDGAECTPSN